MFDYPTLSPQGITEQSFETIRRELSAANIILPSDTAPIVERMIHSTADFDFATITRFSTGAVQAGIHALGNGCAIITDVNMIRMGINASRVQQQGGTLHCFVADDDVRQRAAETGHTRSALGIRMAWEQGLLQDSIVVVGNAPTALFEIIRLMLEKEVRPALVIGVPVGFINVVESKEAFMKTTVVPWIVTQGRKGGSAVAVAIVNALLRLATGTRATETD
ncbi:MAG: precorrin-8X methylmutase [Chloroflexota bacterium]